MKSRRLTAEDAAIAKTLLGHGWLQSDVASLLGCNIGRVSEIATGARFAEIEPADLRSPVPVSRLARIQLEWSLRIARQLHAALPPPGSMI